MDTKKKVTIEAHTAYDHPILATPVALTPAYSLDPHARGVSGSSDTRCAGPGGLTFQNDASISSYGTLQSKARVEVEITDYRVVLRKERVPEYDQYVHLPIQTRLDKATSSGAILLPFFNNSLIANPTTCIE